MAINRAMAQRGIILAHALDGLAAVEKAATDQRVRGGYTRRTVGITVWNASDAGGSGVAEIEIDLETATLFLPTLRALIEVELKKCGVEP